VDEETFNLSIRKFLKMVGVNSQRHIEQAVAAALANGSIAGTWVNFEPIPREGYRLMHGDMVNFGQLMYRFTLRVPPVTSKPTITVQNTEE